MNIADVQLVRKGVLGIAVLIGVLLLAFTNSRLGPAQSMHEMIEWGGIVSIVVCILGFLFHIDLWILGIVTPATYMLATVAALIQTIGASWVGAMLYKEEGGGATM